MRTTDRADDGRQRCPFRGVADVGETAGNLGNGGAVGTYARPGDGGNYARVDNLVAGLPAR